MKHCTKCCFVYDRTAERKVIDSQAKIRSKLFEMTHCPNCGNELQDRMTMPRLGHEINDA